MMKSKLKEYYKYRKTIKRMLTCAGLWEYYKKDQFGFKNFLVVSSIALSLIISFSTLVFCFKSFESSNIIHMSKGLGISLSAYGVIIRIMTIIYHRKNLEKLSVGLSVHFHRNLRILDYQPYLLDHFGLFYRTCFFLKFACSIHFIPVIISVLRSNMNGKYETIFPLVLPFDYTSGGLSYWLVFAIELLYSFFAWIIIVGVDMSLGLNTLHYVGEVKLLASKFQALKVKENYREELKSLVDRHCELIEYHNIIEDVYGLLILYLIIVSAANLCITIYQTTDMTDISVSRMIYFVLWFAVKLTQSYFYAYVGYSVTEENESCIEAIYETEWAESDNLQYRKDMLIVLSQTPKEFQASGMMIVDLEVFTMTVNTALSYYFLLKTLEEKNMIV